MVSKKTDQQEEAILEYNNGAELAYLRYHKKDGDAWELPDDVNKWERRFLEEVDTSKPILRTITKIVRTREPDMHDNRKMKEFLYYYENWEGTNNIGNPMNLVPDHIEGFYQEVLPINVVNAKGKITGSKPGRKQLVYYIEWQGKEQLDKIIGDQDKDTIKYVVKSSPTLRTASFSYEQFANLSFLECARLARQTGGPQMTPYVTAK